MVAVSIDGKTVAQSRSPEKMKDSTGIAKQKPYDTLELQARNETKKFYIDWFKRLRKMDRRDQLSMYANAIAEIYDPHTNYFPPEDKENFDISMTGKLEDWCHTYRARWLCKGGAHRTWQCQLPSG